MKYKRTLLLILIFICCIGKIFSQDTLYWHPAYKLKWDDFKGGIDKTKNHGALSYTGIEFKASYGASGYTFKVRSYFIRKLSWVKFRLQAGLKHEQGHFNIAEIYARKLREALKNYKANPSTFQNDLETIYNNINTERIKTNELYDRETNFSRNNIKQDFWNQKIEKELKNLAEFSE